MRRLNGGLLPPPGERVTIRQRSRAGVPSVAVCSMAVGRHRELLAQSAPTMAAYGRRHGWNVVISCEHLSDRPPSWSKLKLIQELLPQYDFVFWVDADAIMIDLDRNLLDEIDHDADLWFARHPQARKVDESVLNAGVFLARSSDGATKLLEEIWRAEQFIDHNWWENAALLDLLGYSLEPPYQQLRPSAWHDRIGVLDLAWNSVPNYCESPRPAINHHARGDHDSFVLRLESMTSDRLATIDRFPADFRLDKLLVARLRRRFNL